MVKTHGLTHIHLVVGDLERSVRFYKVVLGARELFREEEANLVFLNTPGTRDVITINGGGARSEHSGVLHFGFALQAPEDLDLAVEEVERAGGKLLRRGDRGPGAPYAYVEDPDGYEIEFWYESYEEL